MCSFPDWLAAAEKWEQPNNLVANQLGRNERRETTKVLFDPGSTKILISRKVLAKGAKIIPLQDAKKVTTTTLEGSIQTSELVHLRDLRLPEIDKNRRIDE